jgi:mono/diheme cytochrome c family protein
MKKILKVVVYLLALLVIAIAGLLTYVKAALPDVGDPQDLKIEYTQERIERGRYLANSVVGCIGCHSERDWTKLGAPIIPGTEGKGGELFGKGFGFPGDYYAKNITPHKLSTWTDGEFFRAITTGVSKDGNALFPIMPYQVFGKMDKEDVYSVIAYIRQLPGISSEITPSSSDFPMNFILNTIPSEPQFSTRPPKTDILAYGKYMFDASLCSECHTPRDKGQPIEGMYLAGGFEFPFPDGTLTRSANITSDKETGIGAWTEAAFLARMKLYADSSFVIPSANDGEFKTFMPWESYSKMEEGDLKAIFAYLKTVPAIKNKVVKFEGKSAAP